MSRGEAKQAFNTASGQESTNAGEAASSFSAANDAIDNYNDNLSKFISGNPYTKGGEYDQTILPGLAATADAGASSVRGALQSQAARTGENAAGSAATAAEAGRQATRDVATNDATAEQTRIQNEAGYNQEGVQMSAEPIQAQSSLYGTATGATNAATGNEISAANADKSFWDTLGDSFATALGTTAGGGNNKGGGGAADFA